MYIHAIPQAEFQGERWRRRRDDAAAVKSALSGAQKPRTGADRNAPESDCRQPTGRLIRTGSERLRPHVAVVALMPWHRARMELVRLAAHVGIDTETLQDDRYNVNGVPERA